MISQKENEYRNKWSSGEFIGMTRWFRWEIVYGFASTFENKLFFTKYVFIYDPAHLHWSAVELPLSARSFLLLLRLCRWSEMWDYFKCKLIITEFFFMICLIITNWHTSCAISSSCFLPVTIVGVAAPLLLRPPLSVRIDCIEPAMWGCWK